ncbi:MAG: nucleotide pyrophosphatase [Bacteroidetes bacterium GWF2_42_66]|nr:MAG: nucleotide pyrophosphatase [Bacteroidetes bacterium GWA2_42_15]OFY00305.1 MAG: nucleotide pyrophosphatase [Bacteroidetes bacterium GWE2_42_39]OFY47124.1 MAG: nucleotide pyrophosphatase [Bacteroidetes bacterium GWF2_42_66]HBL76695.1 nucleotide pyrophosphatase [Prolixibacteraceae bacterium]HCR92030.1 nucleotide pyrophosphatase [Prolixibacteraceae bacterium]
MKKILFIIVSIIVASFLFDACSNSSVKTNRLVIIALDGISVEGFNTAKHPRLDQLIAEGVLSLDTRNVMPSVTLPNWTSHLTGSGPEQHGVVNNKWELDSIKLPPVEKDSKGYYPSIFKILKEQVPGIKTAFYYNWAKLIEPYNQEYLDESSFEEGDGYLVNYGKAFDFIVNNKEKPTFVFLYSVHTDHAGHRFGWMSPEYIASIEEADVHIGEFLERLKTEGLYENTHFMFLTDHGGIGKGHGGVSTTEMIVPWSITGTGIKSGEKLTEPNNTVNTAATIAYLFGCKPPLSWTGEVPATIFK